MKLINHLAGIAIGELGQVLRRKGMSRDPLVSELHHSAKLSTGFDSVYIDIIVCICD